MNDGAESLELFGKSKLPDPDVGWKLYKKGVDFKQSLNLYDCIKANENFFIGK